MPGRRRFDDDEDYHPRRRPPRRDEDNDEDFRSCDRRPKGECPIWIPLLIGGGVLGLLVVGTLAYFLLRPARNVQPELVTEVAANDAGMMLPKGAGPAMGGGRVAVDRVVRVRATDRANQLIFGGTDDGYVGITSYGDGGGLQIEVFKTSNGQAKGTVHTPKSGIEGYALSPDGSYVAEINSAPFEGNAVTVYRTSDGNAANKFTPYPRTPATLGQVPQLSWIGLLPGNKLLTINERGGYDVWSVPDFQKLHGKDGKVPGGHSIRQNLFTHTTMNFAITPDGKTLAIFDGTGFTFINPITGDEVGRTDPFVARGQSFNSWGCALNADGTRLAYLRSDRGTTLTIWDVKTGKQVSEVPAANGSGAGFCWWGTDYILVQKGGVSSADVVNVATGQVISEVRFSGIGKLGPTGPGDCLWGYTEGVLIRTNPPTAKLRPGNNIDLTPNGAQFR